jgi:mRNA interferase MazF
VLIVQSNAFNESRIGTVIVAIVTSNLAREAAPGNVRVPRSDSGLPRASVVNVSQLMTIDRTRLTKKVRALPGPVMQRVDEGLRLVTGL